MNKKSLLNNVRGLLNDYPTELTIDSPQSFFGVLNNFVLIYDLLTYCKWKTKSEEIKKEIENEMKEFEKVNINKLRYLTYEYRLKGFNSFITFGKLKELFSVNQEIISSKVQTYFLVLPKKRKTKWYYGSTVGYPAGLEEEEQEETESSKDIGPGSKFEINEEGEVTALE